MEVLSMLFGLIFWPIVLILFWNHTKRRRWSQSVRIASFLMLLAVPALGALSMTHWMFLDEPLIPAAYEGNYQEVSRLLRWRANVNATNEADDTPLIGAASSDNPKLIRLLLDHGAQVNVTNMNGATPLHNAKVSGNKVIIRMLMQAGAR